MPELNATPLTWTALLGKWIEFAQSAVVLPDDQPGRAWKASVPAIIELQAVTFALAELTELPAADQPVARDRAAHLIDRAGATLSRAWDEHIPENVTEIISDARTALAAVDTTS